MDGVSPRMLEWLSTRFKFSYVYFICEYATSINAQPVSAIFILKNYNRTGIQFSIY